MKKKRTVFFTMVKLPDRWIRVGKAYTSRKSAQGWLPFVSKAWRGCRTRVSQFTATWIDGKLTPKSVITLSEKFNMDPPDSSPP